MKLIIFSRFIVSCSVNIASDEAFLKNGQDPVLTVMSAGHTVQVFVNGQPAGKWSIFMKFLESNSAFATSPVFLKFLNK